MEDMFSFFFLSLQKVTQVCRILTGNRVKDRLNPGFSLSVGTWRTVRSCVSRTDSGGTIIPALTFCIITPLFVNTVSELSRY